MTKLAFFASALKHPFTLHEDFIANYKGNQPEWGPLGYVAFKRTYARPLPQGGTEEFWQTLRRVVEGTYRVQQTHCQLMRLPFSLTKAQRSAQKMFKLMWAFKFLPPGRGLWMMGSEVLERLGSAALMNCFRGSTRFWADKRLVTFADAVGQTVEVLAKDGIWRKAQVQSFGKQPMVKVVLRLDGYYSKFHMTFDVTKDHRWFLENGDETTNLKVNDTILVTPTKFKQTADWGVGFAHGLMFGDGSAHTYYPDRHYIRLCGDKSKHRSLLEATEGFVSTTMYKGDPIVTIVRPKENWKAVPTDDKSLEYMAGFLEGWIATDGSARGAVQALSSQNHEAMDWVISRAPLLGYCVTGDTCSPNMETTFGKRSAPLRSVSLKDSPTSYRVIAIIDEGVEEECFCVTEPVTGSFTLEYGVVTGNCSMVTTADIDKDFAEPFTFLMEMSMLGVGVGFDCSGRSKVLITEPTRTPEVYQISDDREGWVEGARRVLNAYVGIGAIPVFDYSLIREAGAPIHGFGGTAAGPGPLKHLLEIELPAVLEGNIGTSIRSSTIVDIANVIGKCVVAGNVRRSSEIALSTADDAEFLSLKDATQHQAAMNNHRWASNNSVMVEVGQNYTALAKQTVTNGEPGYVWLDNARQYGRMVDPPTGVDSRVVGVNPCQPGFAPVLTPEGIRTFEDIAIGSTVWSGSQWTTLTNKVKTGRKKVNRYKTTAGSFLGTAEHRVFQDGLRVEAQHADRIDLCVGPTASSQDLAKQDIVDGWVFGDGSVHKASNDLVYLCVGEDASCIFDDFGSYIGAHRPGIKKYAYEVTTSISAEELPVTYKRKVPSRYKYGSFSTVCGFLKGLFAANGSVCGGRVTLKAASFDVISDVQLMLSALGVRSYYTTNKPTTVTFKNGTYACKESYDLNITSDRKLFRKLIGFVHSSKQTRLDEACRVGESLKPPKCSYDVINTEYVGDFDVYDITVAADEHSYWSGGLLVSNCGEIPLESHECCCLVETFPSRHSSYEDYQLTLKYAYLYAKTVTLIPTHHERTNAVQLRNRRIGLSQSGITKSLRKHGRREHLRWCDLGYSYLRGLDKIYSEWLCVPRSRKMTTVKPSGTVSLLPGEPPGIHYPMAEYYIRRIRIGADSPIVKKLQDAGYYTEPCANTPNTTIVEFPIHEDNFIKGESDVSIWEQVENATNMQRWWADNSVSVTIKFHAHESADIASILELYEDRLKSISFLPHSDHGYKQAPYETITKEMYEARVANLRPYTLDDSKNEVQDRYCDGDRCVIG